jgi:YD repeat-containing protein
MVGYDTFGAKVETSDPDGNVSTTAYDANGRPVTATMPSYTPPGSSTPITPVAYRTYNNLGQMATETDALNHQTSYVYDQLGRVATVTAPNTGVTHYILDSCCAVHGLASSAISLASRRRGMPVQIRWDKALRAHPDVTIKIVPHGHLHDRSGSALYRAPSRK